jgi:hypothetical protein
VKGEEEEEVGMDVLEDFSMLFLDHPLVDGTIIAESNMHHFNFLKAF